MNSSLPPAVPRVRNSLMSTAATGATLVGVLVGVFVTVGVEVLGGVGVIVGVSVGVLETKGVLVTVGVLVRVGVFVGTIVFVGVFVAAEQLPGVEALLRGLGAAAVKSAELLSVSVQPPLPRKSAVVGLGAGAAVPSEQLVPEP